MDYFQKYLKYKAKYISLQNQLRGGDDKQGCCLCDGVDGISGRPAERDERKITYSKCTGYTRYEPPIKNMTLEESKKRGEYFVANAGKLKCAGCGHPEYTHYDTGASEKHWVGDGFTGKFDKNLVKRDILRTCTDPEYNNDVMTLLRARKCHFNPAVAKEGECPQK